MTKKHILTIYIGRFSPFHNGHGEVLSRAQARSDAVLVLIGSINQARNPKNPWTFNERADVIRKWADRPWFTAANGKSPAPVTVLGIRDFPYNDQLWIANVRKVINQYIETLYVTEECKLQKVDPINLEIRITGADRDHSTFYLKYFPEFKLDLVEEDTRVSRFLTATAVREIYFGRAFNGNEITADHAELLLKAFLPTETIDALHTFDKTEMYQELREEHLFNVKYRAPYTPRPALFPDPGLPYEVIFQTVDAIVVQTGHILLIKRRSRPGKGLWALPGGFVNPRERLFDAAIRELREETKIKVPEPILRSSLIFKEDFDYPDRSLRGRTISKGFLFKLPDFVTDGKIELPLVKGADDAEKAMWIPLDEVLKSPELFFEDHYNIIEYMLGKL